jgi:hypothetical protein
MSELTFYALIWLAGAFVGFAVAVLGALTHDYWRAFWRAPSHSAPRLRTGNSNRGR